MIIRKSIILFLILFMFRNARRGFFGYFILTPAKISISIEVSDCPEVTEEAASDEELLEGKSNDERVSTDSSETVEIVENRPECRRYYITIMSFF